MSKILTDIIWQPTGEYLDCRVTRFMESEGIKDWRELILRSTEDTEWFWRQALSFMSFYWYKPYDQLLDLSKGFPFAKWFSGGTTNIVANCLDWHVGKVKGASETKHADNRKPVGANHPAIIWEGDDGTSSTMTYGELNDTSSKVASLLQGLGVKAGDAVGIYMPMVPEVVAVLFGCLKIGAVAVPIFSGYGSEALAVRLKDASAKVLFCADAGKRRGKSIGIKHEVDEACKALPALEHVIVLNHCDTKVDWQAGRDLRWEEAVLSQSVDIATVELAAEHPSLYLYTSGTTGRPKGTVHTHAGALAQIAKELGFAFDVRPSDVFFWVTDIGWMMGPWEMIGVTYWGGTMVLFEGAPNWPDPGKLWEIIERRRVTTLGISPTVVRVLRPLGDQWVHKHSLSSLRLLGSTGETWDEDSYMWFFKHVGGTRCPIINISGGTEIIGCHLQPLPVVPLKPCSLGVNALAMDADVFDENGASIVDTIGHLVCKKPAPSMTKGFLNDPERYLETYFSRFPGVWYHGDWAKKDKDGFWFLYGRSDDTLKVAGKRVGPGEVESVLIEHPSVNEAAVIGVPHEVKGEGIVCFVVLAQEYSPSQELATKLSDWVASKMGGPLRPEKVHFVKALPKTRSGKIVRGAIRKKYLNEPLADLSSVENPDALAEISNQ